MIVWNGFLLCQTYYVSLTNALPAPAPKPFSSCSIIIEFLLARDYIIQFGVSANQYIIISYLFLDIHMSIEFGHLASSGISPTKKEKKKKD